MRAEMGYNPELAKEIEPREKTSLRELWQRAKTEIIDSVTAWLRDEDKDLMRLERIIRRSIDLGQQAAELYRGLIPKSLKKPDKKHQVRGQQIDASSESLEKLNFFKAQKKDTSKKEWPEVKRILLKENVDEQIGIVIERPEDSGNERPDLFQWKRNSLKQGGADSIIVEKVYNLLTEKGNFPTASLAVKNIKTGLELNLDELLPGSFKFVPSYMRQLNKKLNRETAKIEITPIPVDLKSYDSTKGTAGEFYENPYRKTVAYGDITKKGGLLTLLHEISHSWQAIYYEPYGRYQFEDFYNEVVRGLTVIADFQEEVKKGECSEKGFEQVVLGPTKEQFAKLGVEIDERDFVVADQQWETGEVRLASNIDDRWFTLKSEKPQQLAKDYVSEERDAWAHAIKVLRFLRQRGFDLEPQLKTLSDFREVIDDCLDSYQKSLEQRVEFSPAEHRPPRFLKKTKTAA